MGWARINKEVIQNGLLALYDLQTPVERAVNRTLEKNRKGFDAIDAPILTRYAKQLIRIGSLSASALDYVSNRLWKYRMQLLTMGIISEDMITVCEQLSLEI